MKTEIVKSEVLKSAVSLPQEHVKNSQVQVSVLIGM